MPPLRGDVVLIAGEVADHFVDAIDADRRKMVAQRAEVALGIREKPLVHQPLDHLALNFQALAGKFQQIVQTGKQPGLIAGKNEAQPRAVDGYHTQRSRLLGRSKKAVAALEQFAQIELQTAAHGANLVGFELGVDEVLEIRQAVTGRHVEKGQGIRAAPIKVRRDVVGGNGESKYPSLGIAAGHHINVGLVDQIHFGLQLAIGKRHFLPADHRHLVAQVFGADPVERQIGKRCLRAPARGHVQVVDQLLHALAHRLIPQLVFAHIRRQIGIERAESLGPGPFVLHGAQKIHDLPNRAGQVLGRACFDLAHYAIEPFTQQGAQGPAGAIAAEHVQIVNVDIGLAVGAADCRSVHVAQPVVGDHFARDVENQAAQRIALVGIGVHPPIGLLQVLVHG